MLKRLGALFAVSCAVLSLAGPVQAGESGKEKRFNLMDKLRELGGSLKPKKPGMNVVNPNMVILDPRERPGEDAGAYLRPLPEEPEEDSKPEERQVEAGLPCKAEAGAAEASAIKDELVAILKIMRPTHYEAILDALKIDPAQARPEELPRLAAFIKRALEDEAPRTAGRRGGRGR